MLPFTWVYRQTHHRLINLHIEIRSGSDLQLSLTVQHSALTYSWIWFLATFPDLCYKNCLGCFYFAQSALCLCLQTSCFLLAYAFVRNFPGLPFSTCPPDALRLSHWSTTTCSPVHISKSSPPADTPASHYLISPSVYITCSPGLGQFMLCACIQAICTCFPVPDFLPPLWPALPLWACFDCLLVNDCFLLILTLILFSFFDQCLRLAPQSYRLMRSSVAALAFIQGLILSTPQAHFEKSICQV